MVHCQISCNENSYGIIIVDITKKQKNMSEQPIGSTLTEARLHTDDELAGWEQLAAESHTWPKDHEGLQGLKEHHVDRLLGEKGMGHLISSEAATSDEPMLDETAYDSGEHSVSTQEIQYALEDANTIHVDELMSSRTFLARAKDTGIDIAKQGRNDPAYWDLFAEVAEGYAKFRRGKGDEELTVHSLSLICKLPQFLMAQQRIDSNGDDRYDRRDQDKDVASRFNADLRGFFDAYPETSIAGFTKELSMITGYMFSDVSDRKRIVEQLNDTVRGAMHEFAFKQVVERSGYARSDVREATAKEDLQGIDLVIDPDEWDELCLDVKASKYKIRELAAKDNIPNWNRPFYPKLGHEEFRDRRTGKTVEARKDVIVIFSLLEDTWFDDRFTLSDERINVVAGILPDTLEDARTALYNRRQQQEARRHQR